MSFKLIPRDDPAQSIRMRRTLLAFAGGLLHIFFCSIFYGLGFFRSPLPHLLILGTLLLLGAGMAVIVIRLGWNKRFRDPSLTMPQMLWATLWIMTTVYHQSELRTTTLMIFFGVIQFGSFYLNRFQHISVTAFAIFCFGVTILMRQKFHPADFQITQSLGEFLGFSIISLGLTWLGAELSLLRSKLTERNSQLQRAVHRIQKLATTDELTGLFNRRHILDKLEEQRDAVKRGQAPFTLCLLDLDHFKRINDAFGHHTGDLTLKKFAEITGSNLRENDYFARYGGEEFILLMSECNSSQAREVMDDIRATVETADLSSIQKDLKLTVSIGITEFRSGEPIDETFHRADMALYNAKDNGRNRVELK